ncbi:GNAT family N-acetyltransferase [Oceanispirochaeta crateris]|uniref:GNAT family N-acetyltransferase n=2 Tax=Oceanispirochaeta crateris TaxID=2518645 RepID=A0A5C1QRL8_9SPIO|nr:GNAT family N-acetyltransferase [Oceanispirochaeta crateris]
MSMTDYKDAFNLWSETEGMGLRSLDDSESGINAFLQRNPNTNFVCRKGKELVAVILCGHDGRRGYIYHAVVHQNYHRQGIGKSLIHKVLTALDEEGIKKVALVVFAENQKGNDFWQSMGFIKRKDLNYRNLSIDDANV